MSSRSSRDIRGFFPRPKYGSSAYASTNTVSSASAASASSRNRSKVSLDELPLILPGASDTLVPPQSRKTKPSKLKTRKRATEQDVGFEYEDRKQPAKENVGNAALIASPSSAFASSRKRQPLSPRKENIASHVRPRKQSTLFANDGNATSFAIGSAASAASVQQCTNATSIAYGTNAAFSSASAASASTSAGITETSVDGQPCVGGYLFD